jgi:hypothetical protein
MNLSAMHILLIYTVRYEFEMPTIALTIITRSLIPDILINIVNLIECLILLLRRRFSLTLYHRLIDPLETSRAVARLFLLSVSRSYTLG